MSATTAAPKRRDHRWWKERWVAGTYANLKAPEILKGWLIHKAWTVSELARRANRERLAESDKGVSRQMISQLVNGTLHSCEPDLAACIERVLDAPEHGIFDVLPKSGGNGQTVCQQVPAA